MRGCLLQYIRLATRKESFAVGRTEFESIVRDGFYDFEEDTLEDLPTEEVVEGVNCELGLMKSFPVYQAVPRSKVIGKVWSTRWCCSRKGPKQVRPRHVVRQFATSLGVTLPHRFCCVISVLRRRTRPCPRANHCTWSHLEVSTITTTRFGVCKRTLIGLRDASRS